MDGMLTRRLRHKGEDYYPISDVGDYLLSAAKRALESEGGCPLTVIPSGTLEGLLREAREGERERCASICDLYASGCPDDVVIASIARIIRSGK